MKCPVYPIEKCLEFCHDIFEVGIEFTTTIENLLKRYNYRSERTKAFSYLKSSAIQYGLVNASKRQVSLTHASKMLLFARESYKKGEDYAMLKMLVFLKPYLFRNLIYLSDCKPITSVSYLKAFFRDEGVTSSSIKQLMASFMQNLSYCSLIDELGQIVITERSRSLINAIRNKRSFEMYCNEEFDNLREKIKIQVPEVVRTENIIIEEIGAEKMHEFIKNYNANSKNYLRLEIGDDALILAKTRKGVNQKEIIKKILDVLSEFRYIS